MGRLLQFVLFLLLNLQTVLTFQVRGPVRRCPSSSFAAGDTRNNEVFPKQVGRREKTRMNTLASVESKNNNVNHMAQKLNSKSLSEIYNTYEKLITVSIGVAFAVGILYSIAMIGEDSILISSWREFGDKASTAYQNIYDAIAPLGFSDVISVIIGESAAGFLAPLLGGLVLLSRNFRLMFDSIPRRESDVVADGDFLLTKAAALSLLNTIGLPPTLARAISSLFATIPYGIVKLGAKRRRQIDREDKILDDLLADQQEKENLENMQYGVLLSTFVHASNDTVAYDMNEAIPVQQPKKASIDFVEIFSDISKWLQYDVLISNFDGKLSHHGATEIPWLEPAIFGGISAISTQLYCDILYLFFDMGGKPLRDKIQARSFQDWVSVYLSQMIYGAALFVTYEAAQVPAKWMIDAFVSGGLSSCLGSSDYRGCIDDFVLNNAPEISPEEAVYSRIQENLDSLKTFF